LRIPRVTVGARPSVSVMTSSGAFLCDRDNVRLCVVLAAGPGVKDRLGSGPLLSGAAGVGPGVNDRLRSGTLLAGVAIDGGDAIQGGLWVRL